MYIAAICVNCCNLSILQSLNFKSPFNCHGDTLNRLLIAMVIRLLKQSVLPFPFFHELM